MAEAITYADLRFVKAPLRKSVSNRLGKDPEDDEDGEITYENVQVPSAPMGPPSLDPYGLGDKAGVKSEQPIKTWSSVTSPAAGLNLPGCAACTQYLLLGLLLTCLLLGVASICFGVRYMQVSQQLRQVNNVLEATNSSLQQQLHVKITQLGQREQDLQESRKELAQSQEALQAEQGGHQAAEGQLQACKSNREKTEETLRHAEEQRSILEQRIRSIHDTLKPFFTCVSQETCCPVGWILNKRSCFYFSSTRRNWEDSQSHCKSLSSDLAQFKDWYYTGSFSVSLRQVFSRDYVSNSYWIGFDVNNNWKWTDDTSHYGTSKRNSKCPKAEKVTWVAVQSETCMTRLPCICEKAAFRYPDEDD
ncbi:B-cell differentiation antigen CD72 isoform X2 [Choloepus didactylus]|uniref:B-cell differentiation antigen CD72 isoform X2 n=1 Tax=Choloepus didactylus TaxID=27675 RepID=UPI00189D128B|nr:B-cell differentiation antigen CD72 isoform X2 [Choloepus didactylus]